MVSKAETKRQTNNCSHLRKEQTMKPKRVLQSVLWLLALALLLGACSRFADEAPAALSTQAVRTVTNTNDSGPDSLRQAILDADDGDTITFGVTGTITLTSGELLIENKSLVIQGPAGGITISGNNASRVFNAQNTDAVRTVEFHNLTINRGNRGLRIKRLRWWH